MQTIKMNRKIVSFHRERKNIKENQVGILELKNTVRETKISLDELNIRMAMPEEESLNLKINQWKLSNLNNKEKKNEQNVRDLWENIKRSDTSPRRKTERQNIGCRKKYLKK